MKPEGTLELIRSRGRLAFWSFDVRIEFKNQNEKIFRYDKTYTSSESRASFYGNVKIKGGSSLLLLSIIKKIQVNIILKS